MRVPERDAEAQTSYRREMLEAIWNIRLDKKRQYDFFGSFGTDGQRHTRDVEIDALMWAYGLCVRDDAWARFQGGDAPQGREIT